MPVSPRSALVLFAIAMFSSPAMAALVLNNLNDYTNNFDFLATLDVANSWTNNQGTESSSGSPGWYWQNGSPSLTYEAGSADTPGPFSLGDSSIPGDRAMGNYADGSHPKTAWGIVFQNKSGQTISQIEVGYTGEQWRRAETTADMLQFSFTNSAEKITDLVPAEGALPTGWTADPSLSFAALLPLGTPKFFGTPGSSPQNGTLAVNIPNGHFLALRWYDGDVTGDDAALGIDDLTVRFTAIPEPSAFIFGGLVCGVLGVVHHVWLRRAKRQ